MSCKKQAGSASSLSKLPTEIWKECWNYSTRYDLRQLTSVCRYFHHICQRDLFRSLSYGGFELIHLIRGSSQPNLWPLERLIGSFERIRADPTSLQIRAMVEECQFMGLGDPRNLLCDEGFQLVYKNLPAVMATLKLVTMAFIQFLSTCSNVRVVRMSWIDMDDELWGMLGLLPNLEQLILHECRMIGTTNRRLSLNTLNVSSVRRMYEFLPSIRFDVVSPACLKSLILDDEYCNAALLSSLITLGGFPYLVHLAVLIEETTLDTFFTFLRATPQLLSLRLIACPQRIFPCSLPPHIVPLLTSYDGPLNSIILFTNRPLSDIKIRPSVREGPSRSPFFWADHAASLASLSRSTAVVKYLSLYSVIPSLELDPFNAIAACLPDLTILNVSFAGRYPGTSQQNVTDLIVSGHVSLPPRLEVFRLRSSWGFPPQTPFDDANERVLVEKLYGVYSHLREISLGTSALVWHRRGQSWSPMDTGLVQTDSER